MIEPAAESDRPQRPIPASADSAAAGDEYEVLRLGDWWPVASLACFAAALGARYLVRALPVASYYWRIFMPLVATVVLAVLGLLLGLAGLRRPQGRGLARVGVFLNAVVVGLGGLAALAYVYVVVR